jgi:hypothetical protein
MTTFPATPVIHASAKRVASMRLPPATPMRNVCANGDASSVSAAVLGAVLNKPFSAPSGERPAKIAKAAPRQTARPDLRGLEALPRCAREPCVFTSVRRLLLGRTANGRPSSFFQFVRRGLLPAHVSAAQFPPCDAGWRAG